MRNRKKQIYDIKLLPHLTAQLDSFFPLELWEIITEYCFYAEHLHCPLTKKLFVEPVMIDHPKIAPFVYEKAALINIIAERKLEEYEIQTTNIDLYLKPVPIVKCLIDYVVNPQKCDLMKELNRYSISTNLTEELKSELDDNPTMASSRKKIIHFINSFNYPLAARTHPHELHLLHPQHRKAILLICALAGIYSSGNTLIKLYQLNLDRRLTLPALFAGINVAENILEAIKFVLKEAQALNLHLFIRHFLPYARRHCTIDVIDNCMQAIKHKLIKLCKTLILRAEIIKSLESSNSSRCLEAIGFADSINKLGIPFCFIDIRTNIIGSRKVIKECKKIANNPFHLFSPSRDANGFIEPLAKKTISRLGKLSYVLLAGVLAFAVTENPVLALLAFTSALLFQGHISALNTESPKLSFTR